eukprot:m.56890 g.56890  ORF g.56890 m.56890 type:complete len:157 (+) comp9326_c1_seq1:361-831(+)
MRDAGNTMQVRGGNGLWVLLTLAAGCGGVTIRMLGPQFIAREAGNLYADRAVCNSRVDHNGQTHSLTQCGFDTTNPSRSIITGGLLGGGFGTGCNLGSAAQPLASGPLSTLGRGCSVANPPPMCHNLADPTSCRDSLQVSAVDSTSGTLQLGSNAF